MLTELTWLPKEVCKDAVVTEFTWLTQKKYFSVSVYRVELTNKWFSCFGIMDLFVGSI